MLTLYYKPTCPFCKKVLEFAKENDIKLNLLNIVEDEKNAATLIDHGGKRQVPYLVDEEKSTSLYESDDIIEYLGKNYVR